MSSPDSAFRRLAAVLDELRIPFYVGGSLASSVHGLARATMDVDLVAAVHARDAARLAAALGSEFYVDADMIREALGHGRSFNVIHYATSYKFDLFPVTDDPYAQAQWQRVARRPVTLGGGEPFEVPVASAEDTVLNKLAWYRAGGGISERQWKDIRGIVEVQGGRLDREYMRSWAAHLHVADLLEQALSY